jgi:hypothetical protein
MKYKLAVTFESDDPETAADVKRFLLNIAPYMVDNVELTTFAPEGKCYLNAHAQLGMSESEVQDMIGRANMPAFKNWMRGQTASSCPTHGLIYYYGDVERFVKQMVHVDYSPPSD